MNIDLIPYKQEIPSYTFEKKSNHAIACFELTERVPLGALSFKWAAMYSEQSFSYMNNEMYPIGFNVSFKELSYAIPYSYRINSNGTIEDIDVFNACTSYKTMKLHHNFGFIPYKVNSYYLRKYCSRYKNEGYVDNFMSFYKANNQIDYDVFKGTLIGIAEISYQKYIAWLHVFNTKVTKQDYIFKDENLSVNDVLDITLDDLTFVFDSNIKEEDAYMSISNYMSYIQHPSMSTMEVNEILLEHNLKITYVDDLYHYITKDKINKHNKNNILEYNE